MSNSGLRRSVPMRWPPVYCTMFCVNLIDTAVHATSVGTVTTPHKPGLLLPTSFIITIQINSIHNTALIYLFCWVLAPSEKCHISPIFSLKRAINTNTIRIVRSKLIFAPYKPLKLIHDTYVTSQLKLLVCNLFPKHYFFNTNRKFDS